LDKEMIFNSSSKAIKALSAVSFMPSFILM
jgi:hypothetical protein